jgi:hypothetical protein
MVAHTGFLTLARRVQPDGGGGAGPAAPEPSGEGSGAPDHPEEPPPDREEA